MVDNGREPWRFSPLSVVRESLFFTAANLVPIAKWAFAPFAYGLAFHFLMPGAPESGEAAPSFLPVFFLLGFVLLWIRVPLELRVYRKALLDEKPAQFYGLELVAARTWRYLWTYLKVTFLFLALFGPAVMLAAGALAPLIKSGLGEAAPDLYKSLLPALGMFILLGVMYAALAPRVILVFPDVALGGAGSIFNPGGLFVYGKKARWRMVAVMAIIWVPEHTLNALTYLGGGGWEYWKEVASSWWFTVASYVLGFLTLVVSSVAGAVMYRHLRVASALQNAAQD